MGFFQLFFSPIETTLSENFKMLRISLSASHNRTVFLIISFSMGYVFSLGSIKSPLSSLICISLLVPTYVVEIKQILDSVLENEFLRKTQLIEHTCEYTLQRSANICAFLCILSLTITLLLYNFSFFMKIIIVLYCYLKMIHPHSNLKDQSLESFCCCLATFLMIYLFFYSRSFNYWISSVFFAIFSSFGIFWIFLESSLVDYTKTRLK